jgi:aminoglycoside phosphotransferase (APT) family kinase protein
MQWEQGIQDWVEKAAGGQVAETRLLTGGYSNENTLVTIDNGSRYVLRRYLRRNSCAVEAALATRLTGVVPVPEVVAADPDGSEAGEPVLLSVFVPGRQLGEALEHTTEARELGQAAGEALVRIGSVTFEAPGFFDGGDLRPGPPGMEPTSGLDVFVRRCLTEGNAAGHLSDHEQQDLLRYAERAAPTLDSLRGARQLVHSDYNPKNLLVDGRRITAVLDWEFAFSSTPLVDVGNMLRDPRPPGFAEGFLEGYGDRLPPDWRELSQALDLFALADFLTRPVNHRYFAKAVIRIRTLLNN